MKETLVRRQEDRTREACLVRPGTSEDDTVRDAFVNATPGATFFHLSSWRNLVASTYGHEPKELLAFEGDELVGVLPMMLVRSLGGRRNLLSMPYAVYGGPVGRTPAVERALLERAKSLAEELRVGHLELRYFDAPDNDLPESDLYCTFVRDLPETPEEVLERMPKKARAECRKARERYGLEMTQGPWYVDDLSRLFLRNKHQLGSPALPIAHFRGILEQMEDRVSVHLVRHERKPVAAVMGFHFQDTLIAYYAGTEPGADRAVKASNFMYLALQEWAVEQGFRRFDFCRSRRDSGAFSFKKHQGFEEHPLHYRFHLVRNRTLPAFTPSNPRTRFLRKTWAKTPQWFARFGSDRLSRYLP